MKSLNQTSENTTGASTDVNLPPANTNLFTGTYNSIQHMNNSIDSPGRSIEYNNQPFYIQSGKEPVETSNFN